MSETPITPDELRDTLVRQAVRITTLEARVKDAKDAIGDAAMAIIGIGGPLNDSKVGYTREQVREWQGVYAHLTDASYALAKEAIPDA
jgi:hypothetical protein